MPRVHALLECLGLALCEKARKPLAGDGRVRRRAPRRRQGHPRLHPQGTPDRRHPPRPRRTRLPQARGVRRAARSGWSTAWPGSTPCPIRGALIDYLTSWPATIRQVLRRPSDPNGRYDPRRVAVLQARRPARVPAAAAAPGSTPGASRPGPTTGRSPSSAAWASAPRCGSATQRAQPQTLAGGAEVRHRPDRGRAAGRRHGPVRRRCSS